MIKKFSLNKKSLKFLTKLTLIGLISLGLGITGWQVGNVEQVEAQSTTPWIKTYPSNLTEKYIAPNSFSRNSSSPAGSLQNPLTMSEAFSSAQAGTIYWVMAGTYTGPFSTSRSGTESQPIVYRAMPGTLPKIIPSLSISGAHVWVWGLEFTNPGGLSRNGNSALVSVNAPEVKVINNVIHHSDNANGITSFASGQRSILYGNIIYYNGHDINGDDVGNHPHNLYTQNDLSIHGYKYFVHNAIFDGYSNNLQAYGEGGKLIGFHFEENVFGRDMSSGPGSRVLVGGTGGAVHSNKLIANHFHNTIVQMGYARPSQSEVVNNHFFNAIFRQEKIWTKQSSEIAPNVKPSPNIVTGNYFYRTSDYFYVDYILLKTLGYNGATQLDPGVLPIDSQDVWNNNTYYGTFKASAQANGKGFSGNFSGWKTFTAANGKAFDTNSQNPPAPTSPNVTVWPNRYEPGRGMIVVENYPQASSISVNLSSIVQTGKPYTIKTANNFHNAPVIASGTYNGGNIQIPMSGRNYHTFIVLSESSNVPTPTNTPVVQPTATNTPVVEATATPTPTVGVTGPVGEAVRVHFEAESGAISNPMTVVTDSSASNGQYVVSNTGNQGSTTMTVSVPESGSYIIWARIKGLTSANDSFFVSVDGGEEDVFDTSEGRWGDEWEWVRVNGRGGGNPESINPRVFNLSAGNHTINFRTRDAGSQLDRIMVTNDMSSEYSEGMTPVACSEDINQDGVIDLGDYSILVANFFQSPLIDARADVNGDGVVDLTDYSLLVGKFFTSCN